MNIKPLLTGFAIGVLFAMTPSCGAKVCNASNCRTGCCDMKGECQSGASQNACGQLGGACQSCVLGTACNLGTCMSTQLGGGGGTGGSNGGGTGGGTTGGGTTGGGTTGGGTTGGGTTGGGTTGGGTTGGGTTGGGTGGGGGCDGCLFNGSCISRANSNNDTLCGQGGVTCATCTGTFHCQNFACVNTGTGGGTGGGTTGGGTGGGTTGGGTGGGGGTAFIGMSCTNSTQCTSLGAGAKCKTQTVPFGGNAPSTFPPGLGYCTVPCTGTCAGGAVCAGGTSTFPFLFNDTERFCVASCTGQGTCPVAGLQCVQVTDLSVNGQNGCVFLNSLDAGLFTGGGNPSLVGNPCTSDTQCENPPDPILGACQTGTAFPNGYCTANSNLAPADTWCDQAGKTEVGFAAGDGGTNFFCIGTCPTPGSVGTSRAGYTCFRKSATMTGVGILWPKCTASTECAGDPQGRTACNTTSGFCCPTATSTTGCAIDFLE